MIRRSLFPAAVAAVLVLSFVCSCGRKTEPLTPPSTRPEAVQDVRAVARDGVAFLSWAMPARNVEGREMNPADIAGFRIYRAELDREKKKARYKQIAELNLSQPGAAAVKNGRVFWGDAGVRYGQTYAYQIRAISVENDLSRPSEEVRVTPLLSLAPPRRLEAVAGDTRNLLTWDRVSTRSDGSVYEGFVGYNVYRGTEKGRENETPINKEPLRTASYDDTAVVNNTTYYYMVRSVDSPTLPWKESLDSPEASATPRDMTPPAPPTGLTVVPGVGRIFLTWNENREPDLAGYHVYRSRKSGKGYTRLTDKPIDRTTFSDTTVKPGVLYYYVVSAVDQAGNESGFSREQKAYAEKTVR